MNSLALVLTVSLTAAPTEPQIDEALGSKDYARAEALARALVQATPATPGAWVRLATALHEQGRYEDALEALDEAEKHKANPMALWLRRGRALGRLGRADPAFAQLQNAVKYGFAAPDRLRNDADFASLRNDARFAALVTSAEKNARPCEFSAEARQFDFWIGEWDVSASGAPAGRSRVERILHGCVLQENWTSVNGNDGKSFNVYDAATRRWRQTWVDSAGGVTDYSGGLDGRGAMVFLAEETRPDGKPLRRRMTFSRLEGGRVRQLIETSLDAGKSWAPEFDGIYAPVKRAQGG